MKLTFAALVAAALIVPATATSITVLDGYLAALGAVTNSATAVATPAEAAAMVAEILQSGGGITVSNQRLNAAPNSTKVELDGFVDKKLGSSGFFTDTNAIPIFGPKFASGVVLTTGTIQSIVGPNGNDRNGFNNVLDDGVLGDADLQRLNKNRHVSDATVLAFDFKCDDPTKVLALDYVFGSEEYIESIRQANTDVVGIFLDGVNIAKLPLSTRDVSIDSINCAAADPANNFLAGVCSLFVPNEVVPGGGGGGFFDTQLDGYTKPLTAFGTVAAPGATQELKIAIADSGDGTSDSAIMLAASSLRCVSTFTHDSGTYGDPHFKTWSGKHYDFHGACDLVLIKSSTFESGLGIDVHIRTKMKRDMSYISSAALRIGKDVLEVGSKGVYYLNGVEGAELPSEFSGFPFSYTQPNDIEHVFDIHLAGREHIKIKVFKDLVSVLVEQGDYVNFGDSAGLMGEFEQGLMMARDGKTLLEDPSAFGVEWQVRDTEPMLFQDARFPQYPQACTLPTPKPVSQLRRRLSEASSEELAAEKACAHWGEGKDDCVFDILATGDLDMANAGSY
jgi:hypothetical protein